MSKRGDVTDESGIVQQSNERHKIARKKRLLQLKRYSQYERQLEKSSTKKTSTILFKKSPSNAYKEPQKEVRFVGKVRLLEAAARNDVEEVRLLLEVGVSPDVTNDDGLTALHQCCIDNFEEMLCLLMEYGASVNACDSELWTPLHAAAACGHLVLCRHLINNGSDLMAVNCDGMMAYDICDNETTLDFIETEMTKRGITQQLIDETRNLRELSMLKDLKRLTSQGYSLDWRGRNGETFLHIAACNGYIEVAQFLLSQHLVNIDDVDNELWQPVHCAVCWNQLGVLELLLSHGASLEARTRNGETPLDICEDEELRQQIMEMRDHWQKSKPSKSRDLVHRPSTNVRSSSVRRSSMKQKKATSMKEALEEGRVLNISSIGNNNNNNNSMDEETNFNDPGCNNSKKKNSFRFKDKSRGSFNRSISDQPMSSNGSYLDPKDVHPLSSFSASSAGNGSSLDRTHQKSFSSDDEIGTVVVDDVALLNSNRYTSYRSAEIRATDSPLSDGQYPVSNNENNNVIRLGTPLPSALKKTNQLSTPASGKSEGCCCIV